MALLKISSTILFLFLLFGCNVPHPPIATKDSMTRKERQLLLDFLKQEKPNIQEVESYLKMKPYKIVPRDGSLRHSGGDYSNNDVVGFEFLPTDGSWVDYYYRLYTAKYYQGYTGSSYLIISENKRTKEIKWLLHPW